MSLPNRGTRSNLPKHTTTLSNDRISRIGGIPC